MRFAVMAATLTASVSACDPCAGTFRCDGVTEAAIVGQIVDAATGEPLAGVRVEMTAEGGVARPGAAAATTTGTDGVFQLAIPATSRGDAIVTAVVAPPGQPSYSVPGIRVAVTGIAGDATVLHPWAAARPAIPYVIVVYRDVLLENAVVGAVVEFTRTGGPRMFSGDDIVTTVSGAVDAMGWIYLFAQLRAESAGVITGNLRIYSPTGGIYEVQGVTWTAVPRFQQPTAIVVVAIGDV